MDFWQEFNEQSLQAPWFIKPERGDQPQEDLIPSGKAFVFAKSQPDAAYTMMGKMVAALQMSSGEVQLLEGDEKLVEELENLSPKKIVFFGSTFPGTFGEAFHWSGHQVVKTHALEDLLSQPNLKKETWEHLKMFARLS